MQALGAKLAASYSNQCVYI